MNPKYTQLFSPVCDANNCCFYCKKCVDGCSWSKNFMPVKGWKTRQTVSRDRTDGVKILFCPGFEEGEPADGVELNVNGVIALYEKVCAQAADDYRDAVKANFEVDKKLQTLILTKFERFELLREKADAESTMFQCETLLGVHAERLKKLVLEELEKGM